MNDFWLEWKRAVEDLGEALLGMICGILALVTLAAVSITLPLWLIPYAIYKKRKKGTR